MQYLFDNENDNYTDLDLSLIRHNQFFDGQDNFPDFDLRELLFEHYSHPLTFIKKRSRLVDAVLPAYYYN